MQYHAAPFPSSLVHAVMFRFLGANRDRGWGVRDDRGQEKGGQRQCRKRCLGFLEGVQGDKGKQTLKRNEA